MSAYIPYVPTHQIIHATSYLLINSAPFAYKHIHIHVCICIYAHYIHMHINIVRQRDREGRDKATTSVHVCLCTSVYVLTYASMHACMYVKHDSKMPSAVLFVAAAGRMQNCPWRDCKKP